ncbi:hypothetical protein V8F33_011354 [Rhypophila sp. PSN 637]
MPPKATQPAAPAAPAWPEPCSVATYPALAADFVRIPVTVQNKKRVAPLNLPDNRHLPYATDVTDDKLFKVTSATKQRPENSKAIKDLPNNALDIEVDDSADSTRGKGVDGRTIYGAYQRVTGHANLDDLVGLPNPATAKPKTDDEHDAAVRRGSMYFNYACMHNNLCLWRRNGELTGEGIYYLAQRLATYTQQLNPDRGLGPLADGKWWIAPHAYHIVEWAGHDPTKRGASPDNGIRSKALSLAGDQAIAVFGQERGVDKYNFEAASFTFHFVNLNEYWYDDKETEKVSGHWSLIIRHKGTNEAYYLDSMWDRSGIDNTERVALQQRILGLFNAWLKESFQAEKDQDGVDREISTLHPINVTRQFTPNSCGNLCIANLLAFISYGRFGWADVDAWRPEPGKTKTAKPTYLAKKRSEAEMLQDVGRSLHRLMGLRWDDAGDDDYDDGNAPVVFYDEIRKTFQNWKPTPAKPVTPVVPPQPPVQPVQPVQPAVDPEIENKRQEIAQKEASIAKKEARLTKTKSYLDEMRRVLDEQTRAFAAQSSRADARNAALDKLEEDLTRREAALRNGTNSSTPAKPLREQELIQREIDVARREADVAKREAKVTSKEEAVFHKVSELDTREEQLNFAQIRLNTRDDKLDKKEERLQAKETALSQREANLKRPQNIQELLQEIDRREIAVTAREDQVKIEEAQLAKEKAALRNKIHPGPTPPAPTPPAPTRFTEVSSDSEESDTSEPISEKFEQFKARNWLLSTTTSQVDGEEQRLNEADAENKEPEVLLDYEDYEEEENIPNPDNQDGDDDQDKAADGEDEQNGRSSSHHSSAGRSSSAGRASSSGKASSSGESAPSSSKRKYSLVLDGTNEGSRSLKRKMDTLAAQTDYANKKRRRSMNVRENEMRAAVQERISQRELLRQRELEEINRKKT